MRTVASLAIRLALGGILGWALVKLLKSQPVGGTLERILTELKSFLNSAVEDYANQNQSDRHLLSLIGDETRRLLELRKRVNISNDKAVMRLLGVVQGLQKDAPEPFIVGCDQELLWAHPRVVEDSVLTKLRTSYLDLLSRGDVSGQLEIPIEGAKLPQQIAWQRTSLDVGSTSEQKLWIISLQLPDPPTARLKKRLLEESAGTERLSKMAAKLMLNVASAQGGDVDAGQAAANLATPIVEELQRLLRE